MVCDIQLTIRIGQEPPERAPYEDKYDPRPLYEVGSLTNSAS